MAKTAEEKAAAKAAAAEEKAAETAPAATEATVHWRGKSRTYSQAVHGDRFAEYAAEFAGKVGGEMK